MRPSSHECRVIRENGPYGLRESRPAAHRRALPGHRTGSDAARRRRARVAGDRRPCGHGSHRGRRGDPQQRHRAGHRRAHAAHAPAADGERPPAPRAGARRRARRGGHRSPGPLGHCRRPRRRLRPARRRLLRARLHAAAQAAHRLELRARRPRRRLPRAHRLGGDRSPVVRRHPVPLRRGLRLVAAALLGAVPGARGRLPLLGHPDAGGALRRADHARLDRRLLRGLHGHRHGGRPDRPVRDRPMR